VAEQLQCDLLVAGGGINGTAIARDAAGRHLSVILCEQADLASYTSSASTKLIHGGLRYLEYGEIALVRKALRERAVLLRAAPHLVRPLRLVLVHDDSMRPAWMLRAGLWLYDHLALHPDLPASRRIDLTRHPAGRALRPGLRSAFEFSDAWTDDARLVVTTAVDAAERGARVFTRTHLVSARREGSEWVAQATRPDGEKLSIRARALVNATGPWAARFLRDACGLGAHRHLRLVKGSHLVIRRRLGHAFAYVLQSADRRIAFAIPFEDQFTLIGTTDVEFDQSPEAARIDAAEIEYLCALANRYLAQPVARDDIAWTFSGVRPLLDGGADPSALTRDYALELDDRGAPLLTVWGGKVTTFRTLAEEAVDRLSARIGGAGARWTHDALLPGGNLRAALEAGGAGASVLDRYVASLGREYGWMPPEVLRRMACAYGSRLGLVLGSARRVADLGEAIGDGLYEAELEYLADHEWASDADDVLWRRTKLGLHLPPEQQQRVADWFERRLSPLRRTARPAP
jgi:glycerol-3-phosphate dehydrogenase